MSVTRQLGNKKKTKKKVKIFRVKMKNLLARLHDFYNKFHFSTKIVALAVLGSGTISGKTCKVGKNTVLRKCEKLRNVGKTGHLENLGV